jgi:hypothetical protein
MSKRAIRLPDRFYLPRTDPEGREVRDVMPWEGAVSYATDGDRLGIQYADGRVVWLGRAGPAPDGDQGADGDDSSSPFSSDPLRLFADDFEGVNMDALVHGIRSYMDLHPVLKTVWRSDVETLETLRRRALGEESDAGA